MVPDKSDAQWCNCRGVCTCRVTGPAYEQTRFDRACPFHGDNGTMVAVWPKSFSTPMSRNLHPTIEGTT